MAADHADVPHTARANANYAARAPTLKIRPHNLRAVSSFLIAGCAVALAHAQPSKTLQNDTDKQSSFEHAKPSLQVWPTVVRQGEEVTLGIRFEPQAGWHMYWPGINDSGEPARWPSQLPVGFTLGEAQWPVPERHVQPGDIVDHVFNSGFTVLVPVRVSALASADEHEISVRLKWLVCKDACVAEHADESFRVTVLPAETDEKNDALRAAREKIPAWLTSARAAMPKPLPSDGSIKVFVRRGILGIEAADAKSITYMPAAQSVPPENILRGCVGKGEKLRVKLDDTHIGSNARVTGVVEVVRATPTNTGEKSWFWIDMPAMESAPEPTSVVPEREK